MTKTGKTYYPHQQEMIDALMKMDGKSAMALEVVMGQGRHLGKTILVAPRTFTEEMPARKTPTVVIAPTGVARRFADMNPWADATPLPYRAEIGGVRLHDHAGSGKGGVDIDDPADDDLTGPGL